MASKFTSVSLPHDLWELFVEQLPSSLDAERELAALVRSKVKQELGTEVCAEKPFMAWDDYQSCWVVLFAGGSKAREFVRKADAEEYLKQVSQHAAGGGNERRC